jgi:serine/threonine protein kinase
VVKPGGMAERTGQFVSDGRCKHCGLTHEPWVLVCPTTQRPIGPRDEPHKNRVPAAIPPAPVPRAVAPARPWVTPGVQTQSPGRRGAVAQVPGGRGLLGRVLGDRYGVKELIGEGGMGEVYEAEHLAIGRLVAIKVLHPKHAQDREAASRLRHEARVAGTLGHPNICAVYDMGRLDDGSPYLVMERLHGETLAERLKREKTLAVDDLTDIMEQVLSALVAAHQQGIIHRDLKPDNIFLSRREGMRPVPKLLDFGISKAGGLDDTMSKQPGGTMPIGTPYYLSPEQARGDRKFDLRVDLWAAGVILYECLVGQRPFDAKNYNALMVSILSAAPRPVDDLKPGVPPALARIVDKALSKAPEARFQSAADMQEAVRKINELDTQMMPRRVGSLRDLEPQPGSSKRQPPIWEPEPQPGSSKRRPPVWEPEPQPVSSKRVPPIVVKEPTGDDGDATYVFSRADMAFATLPGTGPEEPVPAAEAAPEQPVYLPFTDDDESTLVERPAFLREKTPTPGQGTPPRRKD